MANKNLKQKAYETIKNKIVNCVYQPGEFINEDMLCEELQMSRTPVRDALGRLEQENLIQIKSKVGVIVEPISFSNINMIYETRLLLEPYIVENYCGDLSEHVLETLAMTLEQEAESFRGGTGETFAYDDKFHQLLIGQSKNKYIIQTLHNVQSENSRLRILIGKASDERIRETLEEHKIIYEALAKVDAKTAAGAIRSHIKKSKEAAINGMIKRF